MVGPVVWEMAGVAGLGWRVKNRERERRTTKGYVKIEQLFYADDCDI